jgi:hypothetical protein
MEGVRVDGDAHAVSPVETRRARRSTRLATRSIGGGENRLRSRPRPRIWVVVTAPDPAGRRARVVIKKTTGQILCKSFRRRPVLTVSR